MAEQKIYDTIIIGSGPAGYTAAIYASRGNISTLVCGGQTPGGQLMVTSDVENFPGFSDAITGPDLILKMQKQAKRFGAQMIDDDATKVDFNKNPLEIFCHDTWYKTKTCIISTGAHARWLELESEKRLKGKGISACATCDGYFFKNKDIIVVGGGDSAMEEALFLTKFAKSIKILVRRDIVRASAIMQQRAKDNPKIEFLLNTEVKEFLGEKMLEGVRMINNKTNKESTIDVRGAFIAIGHKPNTEIFKGQIDIDERGYIVRKHHSQTSKENVFVAGDVHDSRYRQAITAAGYGCEAAMDVLKYLEEHGVPVDTSSTSYGQAV